jgi:putative CocE/NonD family hydrolase
VVLRTDVYRPARGRNLPTLVQRLPYDKESVALSNEAIDLQRAVRAGYAVVNQDTRGRFASGGAFRPFAHEAADGEDTIVWAAAQPWSAGKVGMVGASYFGATQWLAASSGPPALRAIAPMLTGPDFYNGWAYQGGAFALGFNLSWCLHSLGPGDATREVIAGRASRTERDALLAVGDRFAELTMRLPLVDQPALNRFATAYRDCLAHPVFDPRWQALSPLASTARIDAAVMSIGGWYDVFLGGTLTGFSALRAANPGASTARHALIIGPWAHGNTTGIYAQRHYGAHASKEEFDLAGAQLEWFDRQLRNGPGPSSRVRLFVMGVNQWREQDDWPLSDTGWTRYYLHSAGRANTAAGDGMLSPEPPADEPHDVFAYDPRDPVPTVGGQTFLPGLTVSANAGPMDQRAVERRPDVLCYTTAELARPVEVTGPIELVLHASSSATDTDFTGKLVDVHPDGRAEILTEGILRCRYRDSLSDPHPIEPGRVYELRIDLWATANVFLPRHRIRLEVSSSNFPRFDRNTNTGGIIAEETSDDLLEAVNRVWHDDAHPSHIVLPVIDRDW